MACYMCEIESFIFFYSCNRASYDSAFVYFIKVAFIVLAAAKTFNSDFCRQVTNALY